MDLNDLATAETAQPLQLVHPATGVDLESDGKPVRLMILGPDTEKMLKLERAIQSKRLKSASRTGRIQLYDRRDRSGDDRASRDVHRRMGEPQPERPAAGLFSRGGQDADARIRLDA